MRLTYTRVISILRAGCCTEAVQPTRQGPASPAARLSGADAAALPNPGGIIVCDAGSARRLVSVHVTEVARVAYVDKTLTCRDCGRSFVFSAGEQEFFANHGLLHEPVRCPECRAARKAQRSATGEVSATTQRSAPRQYFEAVCSACGQVARLPFEPRLDRPVYCSDCFSRQPRAGGSRSPRY